MKITEPPRVKSKFYLIDCHIGYERQQLRAEQKVRNQELKSGFLLIKYKIGWLKH